MEIFRARIEEELKKRQWTQVDLSHESGIDKSYINQILSGQKRFNEDHIVNISRAFSIPIYKLFTSDDLISESSANKLIEDVSALKADLVLVPEYQLKDAYNFQSLTPEKVIDHKAFSKQFLENMFRPFIVESEDCKILVNQNPEHIKNLNREDVFLVNMDLRSPDPRFAKLHPFTNLTSKKQEFFPEIIGVAFEFISFNNSFPCEISDFTVDKNKLISEMVIGRAEWIGIEFKNWRSMKFHLQHRFNEDQAIPLE